MNTLAPMLAALAASATGQDDATLHRYTGHVDALVAVHENAMAASLVVSGLPLGATIESAQLYGHDWFSASSPTATFNGNALGGAPVYDADLAGMGLYGFRWDVSALLHGNGTYSASITGLNQAFGAALLVVYSDPSLPHGVVTVVDSIASVADDSFPETVSVRVPRLAGGPAELWIYTQADDAADTGETIWFDGVPVAGPIDANQGFVASLFHVDVDASDGVNTATITSPADWMGWQLTVVVQSAAVGSVQAGINGP